LLVKLLTETRTLRPLPEGAYSLFTPSLEPAGFLRIITAPVLRVDNVRRDLWSWNKAKSARPGRVGSACRVVIGIKHTNCRSVGSGADGPPGACRDSHVTSCATISSRENTDGFPVSTSGASAVMSECGIVCLPSVCQ